MSSILRKIKRAELVSITDMEETVLIHIISYIMCNNLEKQYLPPELQPFPNLSFEVYDCEPIEERFPDSLKLLNKVLALYALSDEGD